MAIGIGLSAGYLEVVNDIFHPAMPFADGERIVGVRNWDQAENAPQPRTAWDFLAWRGQLGSVEELGAYRSTVQNLGLPDGPVEPATGAEISPSAFRITGVPALLGRTLIEDDAREGAPRVVVLGHGLWRSRFSGDPEILGRTLRIGASTATVVGVMPEGFAFPLNQEFWIPLQADALAGYGPGEGPALTLFGRLTPGSTLEEAQAELGALGVRTAADHPATHERLRPQVVPYVQLFIGDLVGGNGSSRGAHLGQFLFVTLLVLLASNVATMVFARSATRGSEIAVRFALGSSRGRILGQFFVEALVLALLACAAGLALVAWGTGWLSRLVWQVTQGDAPFWVEGGLSPATVVYAVVLAVLGALVAGVVPALKATGSGLQARLRDAAGAGDFALSFGGGWSVMIAGQVALAVLVLPPAITAIAALSEPPFVDPGFAGEEYLSARIALEGDSSAARFLSMRDDMERRLAAEPGVSRVTFATRLPGMDHPTPWMEVEGSGRPEGDWVMATSVDDGFFEAFGAKLVAGRGFIAGDLDSGARVVVVNDHFVEQMLGGRNAVGRRVRYTSRFGEREAIGRPRGLPRSRMREPGEWYEVVGVVSGLGMDTNKDPFFPGEGPGVYHPLDLEALRSGGAWDVRTALHVRGGASAFAPRLRSIAQGVSAELRVNEVLPLDQPVDRVNRIERVVARFFSWGTAAVALIALLISVAGTYSVMAFTVARQTRAIGIRVALGATRSRIVREVFGRAMIPVAVGLGLGAVVWIWLAREHAGLLLTSAGALIVVGALACGVPIRRALGIEPTEALREVG
jgi:predicted permease